jgi:hypothetical protein
MNTINSLDTSIIPDVFYDNVINRNKQNIIETIKLNPSLSLNVVKFYNNVLNLSFRYKNNAKHSSPFKLTWKNISGLSPVLSIPEQITIYQYCVFSMLPNNKIISNFAYLINVINSYLVQLRAAMKMINNKEYAGHYFPLGINVKNNIEMKIFISKFITNNNII